MPYGAWPSPLTAADVAVGAVRRSEPRVAGGWVYWTEQRPLEDGRGVVVRVPLDELDPAPAEVPHTGSANIRTSVHEYGGGAWLPLIAPDGSHWVLGACMDDQRIRLFDVSGGSEPLAVTPEPATAKGMRYADPALVPIPVDGHQGRGPQSVTAWVRESHDPNSREPRNELVTIELDGQVNVVATGADFYSSPRPSPDGSSLAYLSWDHPNMPWDHVRLHLVDLYKGAPLSDTDRVLCDGPALQQPRWSPEGVLHIVSDMSGWWQICHVDDEVGVMTPVLDDAADHRREFGVPPWVFAQDTYGWSDNGELWCTWASGGVGHLGVIRDGRLEEVSSGFTEFGRLTVTHDGAVVTVAANWKSQPAVVKINPDGTHRRLSAEEPTVLDTADVSTPRAFSFDSEGGRQANAFFFPPTSATTAAPDEELPPLIVLSHGGPTGSARSSLDLAIQYWTSRGIAVVDVNYGGSTGYGTEYRNLLRGSWGIVDTQDCIAAALHLAQSGVVDPGRLVIKGGSAGGFTTLCALVDSDVFAAGISRYGVADLEALASDTHKFEARYLDGLIGPWPQRSDLFRQRSPLWRASELSTPMIVLQGTDDRVVPQNQSHELVKALADSGVPHAYVLFEGEGHGFRRGPNIVAALEAELSFLGQVLGFDPADNITPVEMR